MITNIVKSSFIRHGGNAVGRARAHVRYIAFRPDADGLSKQRTFFAPDSDSISAKKVLAEIDQSKSGVLIHKLILSPVIGDVNLIEYTRQVLDELGQKKQLALKWRAVVHDNTQHHHVHVVIFGKDANGRNVRINRNDLDEIRDIGDRYMKREHDMELRLEKEMEKKPGESKTRNINFIQALKNGVKRHQELKEKNAVIQAKALMDLLNRDHSQKREMARLEKNALGERPDKYALAFQQIARWQRQDEKEKRKRKESALPIATKIGDDTITFTQNSSKEELTFLKTRNDDGKLETTLNLRESRRLSRWIANWERWERETARLDLAARKQSKSINSINLELISGTPESFSENTDLESLRKVHEMHGNGQVQINSAELVALENWIKLKERKQPIILSMGKDAPPLVYSMDDPIESLKLLSRIGREALDTKEYKKLNWWIQEKEREQRENRTLEKLLRPKEREPYPGL